MSKKKLMKYKDYSGSVDFDLDSGILYGKIQFINDTVTYEASDLAELKAEFEAAVDDYLETCTEIGKDPQKAYSGTFNVRVGEELHREAVICSAKKDVKLNEFCREEIAEKVKAFKSAEAKKATVVHVNITTAPGKAKENQDIDYMGAKYFTLPTGKNPDVH